MDANQQNFLAQISPIAIQAYNSSGVLPSITVAQAIEESNWGQSQLASEYNNYFGIKGKGTAGSVSMPTTEYNAMGVPYKTTADFAKYNSLQDSVTAHSNFLMDNSRYQDNGFFNATDYKGQAQALVKAGYATDPSYANNLIDLIQTNHLDQLDKGMVPWTKGGSPSTSYASTGNGGFSMDALMTVLKDSGFVIAGIVVGVLGLIFLFGEE